MLRVRLITDPFDLSGYAEHNLLNRGLLDFLHEQFPVWPETARLYRDQIAVECDVTPHSEAGVEALADADGTYYVVVYPGDPITAIITVVATLALTALVLLFLTPKIPTGDQNNQSANNTLGQRVNKPRPGSRIEDIFGAVISIPTMLTVPLLVFEDNLEQEVCYMSVGRGDHDISEVKDGDTPIEQIAGAGVAFYGPDASPNSGVPFLEVGAPIDMPLYDVIKNNEVNGQIMRSPNANNVSGNSDIRFVYPDTIERTGTAVDFTQFFAAGDQLTIGSSGFSSDVGSTTVTEDCRYTSAGQVQFQTFNPTTVFAVGQYVTIANAGFADTNTTGGVTYVDLGGTYQITALSSSTMTLSAPSAVNGDWSKLTDYTSGRTSYRSSNFTVAGTTTGYNVDGTYSVLAVSSGAVTLSNPALVNSAWTNINSLPGHATDYVSPSLSTSGVRWVGPFVVDMPSATQVVCNFVALQGMYRVTKKGKDRPGSVQVLIEVTPCDADGVATGAAVTSYATVSGDGTDKNPKGVTLYAATPAAGRVSVRARRVTPSDLDTDDTVVDEVKWRDLFGTAEVGVPHFGNVTTVHTRTYATQGATSVKERKLNCRAVRKVLVHNSDDTFGPGLAPSQSAADIICHIALDPYLGGRALDELDVPLIYQVVADVVSYFGIAEAGEFNYTFDQDDISSEEMIQSVAQTVFCTAYRQASKLRLYFECQTSDSEMLFNHRNKLPGSETRTVRFGNLNDNDGVELDYISPVDGAKLTVYVPEDQSAVKPKKLAVIGVQYQSVAFLHAYRAYNKIKYQNTTTKFSGLAEATQLVLTQRVEVVDNTRPDVYDGHIKAVSGLTVELSQPFVPKPGGTDYVIQIQREDGVEVIAVVSGADDTHVVLQAAPAAAIVINDQAWADVVYQIVGDDGTRPSAFLLTEKGAFDKRSLDVQAINYDDRYYANDFDYHP